MIFRFLLVIKYASVVNINTPNNLHIAHYTMQVLFSAIINIVICDTSYIILIQTFPFHKHCII